MKKYIIVGLTAYWLFLIVGTINTYADEPISISYREAAIKLVANNEGYKNKVYMDTTGNKTVGIGHKVNDDYSVGEYVDNDTIIDWFVNDIDIAIKCANRFHLSTNNNVNIVLTDMAFNLGCSGLNKFKLVKKHLNNGNMEMAINEIINSNYYNQVTNRADRNIALINK